MIYEKLQKARVLLQNKKLKKSGKNKFSGFEYFELADFLPAVNQIFDDLKLFSNFSMLEKCATLTIYDSEDKSETIFTSPVEELDLKGCNKIQALGGVHTYLKRYLYLNALEIVEADMFDPLVGSDELKEKKKVEKPIYEKKKNNEDDIDIISNANGCKSLEECDTYWVQNAGKCSGTIARKQLAEALAKRREELNK